MILARSHNLNINIYDTARNGLVTEHMVIPRNESSNTITIQRRGDHYNGINITPQKARTVISPSMPSTHEQSVILPAPWSLAPLPETTPVLLKHLVADSNSHSKVAGSNSTTSPLEMHQGKQPMSRALILELRESASCTINRGTRKILLSLGIWGRHHGCGGNPGRGRPHAAPKSIKTCVTPASSRIVKSKKSSNLSNLWVLDRTIGNSKHDTKDVTSPLGNIIPVCSMPRHPTKAPNVKNVPVLISVKREKKPEFKKLRLCLLNLRSIGDDIKAGKIKDLVTDEEHDLDGAFFTETWLRADHTSTQQIGDITPPGYSFHHRARQGRKGGGVGALLKSGLKTKVLPHTTFKSFEHLDMLVSLSNAHLHIITIYRPPLHKRIN